MYKKINKKILFLTLLGALILPALSYAATIEGMVDGAVSAALYIAGGVVVILWVATGIIFLTAQGSPEKISSGKKALLAAIAGTILCIIAAGAASLVSGIFHL